MSTDDPFRPQPGEPPADAIRPTPPAPVDAFSPIRLDHQPVPPTADYPGEPAVARPPHPGFGFAVLWCLAFLFVTYSVLIGVFVVAFVIQGALSGNLEGHLRAATAVEQAPGPQGGDPPKLRMTKPLADAFAPAFLVAELVSVLFVLLVIRLAVGRDWKRQLALGLPSLNHIVLTLLSLPAFLILPVGIHELAKRFIPSFMGEDAEAIAELFKMWPVWFGVLVVGLGPGLGEELWCRGFLGRGLVARHGVVAGVLLTSLLFGLLHIDPAYAVVTGFMGVWLHYVYLTGRSLWPPILLHTVNNSMAVLSAHLPQPGVLEKEPSDIPLALYGAAALLLVAIAWAMYRSRPLLVSATDEPGQWWRQAYPGVELPPADSGTFLIRRYWPGLLASLGVAAALGVFALVIYLVETGRLGG